MTRDEVLAALSRAEVDYVKVQVESKTVWEFGDAEWKAKALRAAAEIIRESGWRPIAAAPSDRTLILVGRWHHGKWQWKETWFASKAAEDGYTHYLPEPAPPAREVENG